jgi:hypothetical protein
MITADLDGVWTPVWQRFLLDDEQAKRQGHMSTSLEAAPHGTYVPMEYFRVQTTDSDDGDVENEIIDIYDGRGNFIRFRWDETAERWIASDEPITYTIPAGKYGYGGTGIPELTLTRYPTLALSAYSGSDAPHPAYVGRYHATSLGDPKAAVKLPPQQLEYKGDEQHLKWTIEPSVQEAAILVMGRGLPPLDPDRAKSGHNLGQAFGQIFVTQSKLDQVSVSFCGFDPTQAGSYASKGLYSATSLGTKPVDTHPHNLGQIFQGALIFGFPEQNSYDYVQATYIEGSPNIPAGIWPEPVETEEDDTHSTFVSRTTDEAQAYSVSFGLSAGIEGLFSVKGSLAYSGKTETQNKNQSRFTVSRKVAKIWAAHLDIPSLALHDGYLGGIKTQTYDLLSGDTTFGWGDDFVPTWGTHYANSITHGSITLAKTWFSLQAEETAVENKVKIEESASATLEGVTAGADFGLEQEWKSKTGLEISQEDTQHFGIGTPDPVGIFLDLRPTSELLSPIFLPYDDKDEWGKFAPWVWTKVRSSFEDWLTEQGLNQPIDQDRIESYRPHGFTIKLEKIALEQTGGSFSLSGSTLKLGGQIWISQIEDPDPAGVKKASDPITAPESLPVALISQTSMHVDQSQSRLSSAPSLAWARNYGQQIFGDRWAASSTPGVPFDASCQIAERWLGCRIATTAGNVKAGPNGGLCFALTLHNLTLTGGIAEGGISNVLELNRSVPNTTLAVEAPFVDLPKGQSQMPTTTVDAVASVGDVHSAFGSTGVIAVRFTFSVTDSGPFQD